MTAILDPTVILAAADRSDLNHEAATAWFRRVTEPLAMSALALAECDHLLARTLGRGAPDALLEAIEAGTIDLLSPTRPDLARARALRAEAGDARISLSDAVCVVMATRLGVRRIGTFDRRPYSVLRSLAGAAFDIEP
jgi:predicted nucleic acid-binding protein